MHVHVDVDVRTGEGFGFVALDELQGDQRAGIFMDPLDVPAEPPGELAYPDPAQTTAVSAISTSAGMPSRW